MKVDFCEGEDPRDHYNTIAKMDLGTFSRAYHAQDCAGYHLFMVIAALAAYLQTVLAVYLTLLALFGDGTYLTFVSLIAGVVAILTFLRRPVIIGAELLMKYRYLTLLGRFIRRLS